MFNNSDLGNCKILCLSSNVKRINTSINTILQYINHKNTLNFYISENKIKLYII